MCHYSSIHMHMHVHLCSIHLWSSVADALIEREKEAARCEHSCRHINSQPLLCLHLPLDNDHYMYLYIVHVHKTSIFEYIDQTRPHQNIRQKSMLVTIRLLDTFFFEVWVIMVRQIIITIVANVINYKQL